MIRITLPYHLRRLANIQGELQIPAPSPPTIGNLLDTLESLYPVLRGTLRDHGTLARRPFIRFYANQQDLSHDPPETPLPPEILSGEKPFMIVGAMSGG